MRIPSLVRYVRALTGLVILAGFTSVASSAPNPPPLLCVEGGDCVETPEPVVQPPVEPPSGDGYTLANATAGLPFNFNTPIEPNITSEATVTPSTIDSNMVNGRRITLQAGNYGNLNFGTQDQEIILEAGVVIGTLSFANTARRLHFRGAPARGHLIRTVSTGGSFNNVISDLMFDGINVDDQGGNGQNQFHGTRVAVINSSIVQWSYAMGNFHDVTDFILANSYVYTYGGTQANMRSHSALRYVVVDNRLRKSGSGHHALRLHGDDDPNERPADLLYVARNQIDGARVAIRGTGSQGAEDGGVSGASAGIGTAWFLDNVVYQPGDNNASLFTGNSTHDSDRPQMLYLSGNTLYSDRATWMSPGVPRSNWAIGDDNPHYPYQPPPATWEFQ